MFNLRIIKYSICVCAFSLFATNSYAAFCRVYDPIWRAGHSQTETALKERITLLGTNVSNERATTTDELLAALQVMVSQTSASSSKKQAAIKSTSEALTATLTEQHRREELARIKEQFSYETGTGVKACENTELLAGIMGTLDTSSLHGAEQASQVDVAAGKTTSLEDAIRTRLDPSSADASILLESGSSSKKQAVIAQLAGLPIEKPKGSIIGTAAADALMLRARKLEALRSPGIVSLSMVAYNSDEVAPAMDKLIDQYGGGSKYSEWSQGLATQSERGLIIELGRLRAVSMRLNQYLKEQDNRLAALFATMVAVQSGGGL